jgi:hypothetical protein
MSPKDAHGSTDGPHVSADGKRIAYVALIQVPAGYVSFG